MHDGECAHWIGRFEAVQLQQFARRWGSSAVATQGVEVPANQQCDYHEWRHDQRSDVGLDPQTQSPTAAWSVSKLWQKSQRCRLDLHAHGL